MIELILGIFILLVIFVASSFFLITSDFKDIQLFAKIVLFVILVYIILYLLYKKPIQIKLISLVVAVIASVVVFIFPDSIVFVVLATILLAAIIEGYIICYLKQNEKLLTWFFKIRERILENAFETLMIIFISLFLLLVSLHNILSPPLIDVEPQIFEMKTPAGDSLIGAISITNRGVSDINISIKIESVENWMKIALNNLKINSEQTRNVNFSMYIPPQISVGEYRGTIKIIYKNKSIVDRPILLVVQPQSQFQVTVTAPDKVNKTDNFYVKINIINTGDSPVHGINIRLNESKTKALKLNEVESEKIINLLPNNANFSTDWWFEANETGWQTIQFDINSNNARNQTIITIVKVE